VHARSCRIERARSILQEHFGDRSDGEFLIVFKIREGTAGVSPALGRSIREAAKAVPGGMATDLRNAPDGVGRWAVAGHKPATAGRSASRALTVSLLVA